MKNEFQKSAIPNRQGRFKKRATTTLIAITLSFSAVTFAKDSLYSEGQKQLDNREWRAAQQTFNQILENKSGRQDAALYWLAYAQFKSSEHQSALNTIKKLGRDFPQSRWIDDAQALKVEIRDVQGDSAEIDDDELKLYAINSLMSSPSKKTVPILTKIIKGNSSDKIKKRAMFVLTQTNSADAFEEIAKLAAEDSNETIQRYAIEMLGVSGTKKSIDLLSNVYQQSNNENIKRRILQSYMVAGEHKQLLDLARSEKSEPLKVKAIDLLGVMGRSQDLVSLYKEKAFSAQRERIIHGLAVGGSSEELVEIINSEKDSELVVTAVEKMGIIGGRKTEGKLIEIYNNDADREVKYAVIKALFVQGNAKQLVSLVKKEKDPALKRKMLKNLSIMGGDESSEFFNEILEGEG